MYREYMAVLKGDGKNCVTAQQRQNWDCVDVTRSQEMQLWKDSETAAKEWAAVGLCGRRADPGIFLFTL